MKKYISVLLFLLSVNANAELKILNCVDTDNAANVAILTYLNNGSGDLLWEEPWHSASSNAVANSSEEYGDTYELQDFYSNEDGNFELILKPDLVASKTSGHVEILFSGKIQDTYFCK